MCGFRPSRAPRLRRPPFSSVMVQRESLCFLQIVGGARRYRTAEKRFAVLYLCLTQTQLALPGRSASGHRAILCINHPGQNWSRRYAWMKCFSGLKGGSLGSFSVSGSSKSESASGLYRRSEELLGQKTRWERRLGAAPVYDQKGTSSASSLDFSARSSLRIDSTRMNQDRTFFVSGFLMELPFSSRIRSRLRSVPSTSM